MMKIIYVIMLVFVVSCGGTDSKSSTRSADDEKAPDESAAVNSEPDNPQINEDESPVVIKDVTRKELNAVLAKGPANILAMVQTASHKTGGRFAGFEIVSFRLNGSEVLGLRKGDILTRVNGLKIETPDQYFEVFERLKKADSIKFDIIRDGESQTIENTILP
jgi:type II secretion system protein C